MQKFKKLLKSQKRQPNPASPLGDSPTQPITPASQPVPIDDPPSYDQDQIDRLRDELQQVRLQLSEAQSRSSNPTPVTDQASNPAPYVAETLPNYASIQTPQVQHQINQNQASLRREEASAIALLLEHGWNTASWEPNCNLEKRNAALYWAATKGHVAAVRYLVKHGASGMTEEVGVAWGNSALENAAKANYVAIVQILMEQATEWKLKKDSALRVAAIEGHVEVVRLLLGKWPRAAESYSCSREGALSCAAERGHEAIVRLILDKGVDYAVQSQMGAIAPLCRAVDAGQTTMVQLLLEDQILAVDSLDTDVVKDALLRAVKKGHDTIVHMILDLGIGVDRWSMFYAVEGGNDSILRQLLAAGGKPTPCLHHAVSTGNKSMVQLLLDHNAEASKGLSSAAGRGHLSIAQLLLDHGAAVDVLDGNNLTPLHYAVENGRREVAELLLERGANVSAQDYEGKTPLYFAVVSGHKATVDLILRHETANSMVGKAHMQKAFEEAVIKGATEVIQLLIAYGFHFNFNAGSEEKLLGVVAEKGFYSMVQLLLDNGANTEGKDYRGRTALHLAAMNGHYEVVKELLERGADPTVRNKFGRTAKYWAVQNGHTHIARLLEDNSSLHHPKPIGQENITVAGLASPTKESPESGLQTVEKKTSPTVTQLHATQPREAMDYTDMSVLRWD